MKNAPFCCFFRKHVKYGTNNSCLWSSALSGDDNGLAICSAALRNLSTATSPRSLTGERAAACFGAAKRLLSCCDQPQVRVDCAAAIVNFVDATQVQDLQVGGRLRWLRSLLDEVYAPPKSPPLREIICPQEAKKTHIVCRGKGG